MRALRATDRPVGRMSARRTRVGSGRAASFESEGFDKVDCVSEMIVIVRFKECDGKDFVRETRLWGLTELTSRESKKRSSSVRNTGILSLSAGKTW